MKKLTDLTDSELESIYKQFFFDEDTEHEFYLIRDDYGGIQMGQDSDSGMEVNMTNDGSIYLYCCYNGEVYTNESIGEVIPHLRNLGVLPFCL